MDQVPVVDMSEIGEIVDGIAGDNAKWKLIAGKIRDGLGNIGFIYLKNHGIDKALITKAFAKMQKFFDLDRQIKLKYKKTSSFGGDYKAWSGYSEPGDELLHPSSLKELRETYDILHGAGVYPDLDVPGFSTAFSEVYKACNELAKKVIILFAISLNLDPKFFLDYCTHIDDITLPRFGNMRALYYPPIPDDMDVTPGTIRLGEHSDYGLLTFLFQDMIGGLEVQAVDGKWITATPIPDTILVNTGDLLEFWTGCIYPATKHRVIIPHDLNQKCSARYSIAYFLVPDVDTEVSSLKIAKTSSEEKRLTASSRPNWEMESVNSIEYILSRMAHSYDIVSFPPLPVDDVFKTSGLLTLQKKNFEISRAPALNDQWESYFLLPFRPSIELKNEDLVQQFRNNCLSCKLGEIFKLLS